MRAKFTFSLRRQEVPRARAETLVTVWRARFNKSGTGFAGGEPDGAEDVARFDVHSLDAGGRGWGCGAIMRTYGTQDTRGGASLYRLTLPLCRRCFLKKAPPWPH